MVNQEVTMGNQEVAMVNLDGKQKGEEDLQKGEFMSIFFTLLWSVVKQFYLLNF